MSGRVFIYLFLGFTAVFAVALWYFQTRGHLEEITGVDAVTIAGVTHPVEDYQGIDADTSPLRLRGCFRLTGPVEAPTVAEPTPLTTAGWFDCFNVETLTVDLAAGDARAVLAEFNEPYGFNRVVAIYPDGRAFQWRQMNECGKAQADGAALPAQCPEVSE